MTIPKFFKKKSTYILLVLILGAWAWWSFGNKKSVQDLYETERVERINLERTIEVTGEIKPAQRIGLSFETSGVLKDVLKKVGDEVKAGDVIAELKNDDAEFSFRRAGASLEAAVANLRAREAGETIQSIKVSEADVEKAQAAYDKSLVDVESTKVTSQNSIKNAELALATAKSNLENTGITTEESILDAYADLRIALSGSLGVMQGALTDGDHIIGVDDTASNDSYERLLGISSSGSKAAAETEYKQARDAKKAAETAISGISNASSTSAQNALDSAGSLTSAALLAIQSYLTQVQKVLASTITGTSLTEMELSSKRSLIDGDRSSISGQKTTVETAIQAVKNAKIGKSTGTDGLQNAYETAQVNLEIAITNAETQVKTAEANVVIAKASLDSALAGLDLKKAGPRDVDLAPLRAAVSEAQVAYEQAENNLTKVQIIAPVDGVVTEIIPKIGEQTNSTAPSVRMIGFADYDIELLVPEADVAKVKVGQPATFTLDAYGDSVEFTGIVVAEEPDQTTVQDAVYYKTRVQITSKDAEAEFKPGMTANVTIHATKIENALVVSTRAIKTNVDTNEQSIRILNGQDIVDRSIKTGLRGDDGKTEVTEGVKEGDIVIVSEN